MTVAVEELPPPYNIGSSVVEAKASLPFVYVTINEDQSFPFRVGELITGTVYVTPKIDIKFESLVIDLNESIILRARKWSVSPSLNRSIVLDRHSISPAAYPSDKVFRKGFRYSFTYNMRVPPMHSAVHCECDLPFHYHLPASLGSPTEAFDEELDVSEKHVVVSYQVRARIMGPNDKALYRSGQFFTLIPEYPPALLDWDLRPQAVNSLLPNGAVSIHVSRVPIIYIDRPDPTNVDVKLQFESLSTMPRIKSVKTKLIGLTTSAMEQMNRYPDPYDPEVLTKSEEYPSTTIPLDNFSIVSKPMMTELTIPLYTPRRKLRKIVPTFFSCHATRQYRMKLTVHFKYSKASIIFPVVLIYDFGPPYNYS